ncbi:WecB/TagA/CpsF family glycosyltransferase [Rubrobacter calidifluminis]|uniref:WecB/TagA/CpsF family glycosyltransferase n=1 Tax=Rubrobacter calidifluminis TaxID=1392640 RepID=UPI002361A94F|nr:WecB/TagA/CpsF family glycosyltransferase [Rubrobacter calidifluminis]
MGADTKERVDILGVGVDPLEVGELHRRLARAVRRGEHALFLNVNAHALNLLYEDEELRSFFGRAQVVFCDGAGVMLAARLLGRRIPERITYADWIWRLASLATAEGFTLYFLGGRPGVADEAARNLRRLNPGLEVRGTHHGHFDHRSGSPQNEAVIKQINAASPDILLVGMGMPLQERWLMENWERIDARVALTGGAVFDYASGRLRRGPRLLTDNGLEWLARLFIEPRRLWRRYLIGNPLFLWRVLGQRWRGHTHGG